MADISKITLPNGTTYNIKDATARQSISNLQTTLSGGMHYVGTTTTTLTDGASTTPIKISNRDYSPISGDVVIYNSLEFIYSSIDNKWHEFGSTGSLKALAFKNQASGSYTPAGTISQPTFTGTSSAINLSIAKDSTNGNYTPAGSVSQPIFTGNQITMSSDYTPTGSVTVGTKTTINKTATVSSQAVTGSAPATYTPAGTISVAFTGGTTNSTGTFTPSGNISFTNSNKTATVSKTSGVATYTPEGQVGIPTISIDTAGTTTTIKNPTSITVAKTVTTSAPGQTAPANVVTYAAVNSETLSLYQLGYTTGASISTSNVSVKTGDATYKSSQPTFTGTGARLVTGNISVPSSATFTGSEGTVNVSGTSAGSISNPTFTGTAVRLVTGNIPVPSTYEATFSGTTATISASATPTGTVSKPTFSGTKVKISGTHTPTGTVSQPTFSGTESTITVS